MAVEVRVKVTVNVAAIQAKIDSLLDDDVMLQIHNVFAQLCDEYVPYLSGELASTQVTSKYVKYGGVPYGRYQYFLETDNRTRTVHPKATHQWDKVMMSEKGDLFIAKIAEILKEKASRMYG